MVRAPDQISQHAAQTIAHRADLAGAAVEGAQLFERGAGVGHAIVHIEALIKAERLAPLTFRHVGKLDRRLLAPEQIGTERHITLGGQTVADLTHEIINAEYFLQHDHAGAAAGIGCRQKNPETSRRPQL